MVVFSNLEQLKAFAPRLDQVKVLVSKTDCRPGLPPVPEIHSALQ